MCILFWPLQSSVSSHEAQFSQNEFLQKQGVNFVYRKWSHYWKRKSQRIDSSKKPSFSRVNVSSLLTVNVLWSFVKRRLNKYYYSYTHMCIIWREQLADKLLCWHLSSFFRRTQKGTRDDNAVMNAFDHRRRMTEKGIERVKCED